MLKRFIISLCLLFIFNSTSFSSENEPMFGNLNEYSSSSLDSLRNELLSEPMTSFEFENVIIQIENCKRKVKLTASVDDVLLLYRWEDYLGIPFEYRGILGAVWCWESAMRTKSRTGGLIRGDYHGGVSMAHGPFQLWPWHRSWCGIEKSGGADNLLVASWCYWKRVLDRLDYRVTREKWDCEHPIRVAEALTANGPFYIKKRCSAASMHWAEWEKWMNARIALQEEENVGTEKTSDLEL
jgi:hypothetical protein